MFQQRDEAELRTNCDKTQQTKSIKRKNEKRKKYYENRNFHMSRWKTPRAQLKLEVRI